VLISIGILRQNGQWKDTTTLFLLREHCKPLRMSLESGHLSKDVRLLGKSV